jgi:hypothetical protein
VKEDVSQHMCLMLRYVSWAKSNRLQVWHTILQVLSTLFFRT